jgi:CRP-like cAMP-binding protein
MEKTQVFYNHIKRFINIDPEQFLEILPFFHPGKVAKKEALMRGGRHCRNCFFVLEGCLQMYYINEKGVEKTVQFAIENWWLSDFLAYHHQEKSDFFIRAVEPSHVLSLSHENQQKLLAAHPLMESYFRQVYQIAYGASIMRVKYLFDYSKEEIFFHFTSQFPEFVQRVPQYMLASYLGLTPEYVSEIRKKLS